MFLKCQLVAIVAIILAQCVMANKFNVSLTDLIGCEEYRISAKGYTYADFFEVNTMKNNRVKDNERLHLKFYVLASMDAHILLSEVDNPRRSDRVYEIVLGAGGNTFSAIRTMMSRRRVATTLSSDLLSNLDPMPVEIVQTKDGELLVNIPNFAEPHLNFTDESPLNVRFVSFSSYGSIQAKWYYDCLFDGFVGEMEAQNKAISNDERLVADILSISDIELPPPNIKEIAFSFKIRSVEFNQQSSVLSTRLHLMMNWTDSRLKWDPKDYGDIQYIVRPMIDVWYPTLNIVDGALSTFKGFEPFHTLKINSDGNVTALARNAVIHTWCFDMSVDWPNDVTNCDIIIETANKKINLAYDTSSAMADKSINELSEWIIEKVQASYVTYESKRNGSNSTKQYHLQSIDGDLKIQVTISRNSAFYHCVFTAPALVAESLILLAFFLTKYQRGGLNLVAILVVSLAFMFVVKHAPPILLPDIVVVYQVLMQIATFTYSLHVLSMWLEFYPPKCQPCSCIMSVINCSPLRFVLAMKYEDSTAYVNAQEYPWKELSKILNRIFFIVILITFICMNSLF